MSQRTEASAVQNRRDRRGAATGAAGFLVVMELCSGMLQGWYPVLVSDLKDLFGVGDSQVNAVVTVYLLATVVWVPLLAKLGDLFGHRRVLVGAASMVAAGALLSAIAPTFGILLAGRAMQGALGAFLPLEFAIVRDRDPGSTGRSIGRLIAALMIGGAVGAVAAGLLSDTFDNPRVVLAVPGVLLALGVPILIARVPETKVRTTGRVDWRGAFLLGFGLLAALTGISNGNLWGWADPKTISSLVIGIGLLAVWVWTARTTANPMVDLTMLTRNAIALPIIIASIYGAQLFGSQIVSSLFLQADPSETGYGLGLSAGGTGGIILAMTLMMVVGATLGDRMSRRIGAPAVVVLGGVLVAASFALMILVPATTTLFALWSTISGFGNGLLASVLAGVVVSRAPADSVGIASGLYNASRTAAGALGAAVFALVLSLFTTLDSDGKDIPTESAFHVVWGLCLGLAALVTLLGPRLGATRQSAGELGARAEP